MRHVQMSSASRGSSSLVSTGSRAPVPVPADAAQDAHFVHLMWSYGDTGGLVRGDELAARLKCDYFLQLARDISNRRVIHFVWRDVIWMPFFQFEIAAHTVRSDIRILIDELSGALDNWEVAKWFVEPNTCLDGEMPITQFSEQFRRVHDAARSLRYLHCN